MTPARDVDDLLSVLAAGADVPEDGADSIGLLDHSLQCAAVLARRRPDDTELTAAGLLHDIGHVLEPGDVAGHGTHGARYLRPVLGARVADLVELHVTAKRWLVATDPAYMERLSPRSRQTLIAQGLALSPEERDRFEAETHQVDAVALRRADEAAKFNGRRVPDLESWRPLLETLAARP